MAGPGRYAQYLGVLATKEQPGYYFDGRSSYARPNPHRFGVTVPMGPQLSGFHLVASELPYRGIQGEMRVWWVDGRRSEFSCGMARCVTCEQMPGRPKEGAQAA